MLEFVLRPGQALIIVSPNSGETYEVSVPSIRGDAVRLAVDAPRHVAVHRSEVYAELQQEIAQAADTFRTES